MGVGRAGFVDGLSQDRDGVVGLHRIALDVALAGLRLVDLGEGLG